MTVGITPVLNMLFMTGAMNSVITSGASLRCSEARPCVSWAFFFFISFIASATSCFVMGIESC